MEKVELVHKDLHVIHIQTANAILQYLAKQPFEQVHQLIPGLQNVPQLDAYLEAQENKKKNKPQIAKPDPVKV